MTDKLARRNQEIAGIMTLSEYKDYLTEAIGMEANFTSDKTARRAFVVLVKHLREMDTNDQYMQDAWHEHDELPDAARRKDALRAALAEYRSYDKAEQLSTVFLVDLVQVARPQEGFV